MNSIILVTGASSGIGLAITRQCLAEGHRVFAVSREPQQSPLAELHSHFPQQLVLLACDLAHWQSIELLGQQLREHTDVLDQVFHCAAVLHDASRSMQPEKQLEQLDPQTLDYSFRLNTIAPMLLAKATLGLLKQSQSSHFAALSARVGSIADNQLGGWYSYRTSKAALNQFLRTFSLEARRRAPNLTVLVLHPGTTDTPLSAPFQRNVPPGKLFTADWVAQRLRAIVANADTTHSGQFIGWNGEGLPW